MPKTEPIKRDPWASWRGMVLEAKERWGCGTEEITVTGEEDYNKAAAEGKAP